MSMGNPFTVAPQTGLEIAGARDAHDDRVSTRRGLLAVAGVLTSGFAIAVGAAHTPALLPQTIQLGIPASFSGVFSGAGLNLHSGGAIAALALLFASYWFVVSLSSQLSPRVVLMAIAALNLLILLGPPLVSTDVFSYQAYARMGALYGTNPYTNGPHAIMPDTVFPYIGADWSYIPSAYGPIFTVFSYVLAPLSVAASVFAYKTIAAVSCLGIVWLVWQCARLRRTDPVKAVALVGLNPLLVVYGVGGGHNDLLMLVALVGGVYAFLLSRERLGGGLSVIAAGIKLTAGIILPFALAAGGPRRGRGRRDLLIGAGIGLAVVAILSLSLFGIGSIEMLKTINKSQMEGDWQTIPGFLSAALGLVTVSHIVGYALAAVFLVITFRLLRRVWHGTMDWIDGAGWATLLMLAASSSMLPWYVGWLLPLAALGRDRRLVKGSLIMTGVVLAFQLVGYIPHASSLV
ncbi:MAG TPA: polyprenol phosphomannose-dependent alpha 1,6 mannosyltransferase MptB [Solirubrobacteraceae bacterium]|nr:polyprenol phosphomannose-dependent alpha 1,6 mannosyltransferase MptB [Solirubrobacteraceae bacterium]